MRPQKHLTRTVAAALDIDLWPSPNTALAQKLEELESKYQRHDKSIVAMLAAIRELMNPAPVKRRGIGFTAKVD